GGSGAGVARLPAGDLEHAARLRRRGHRAEAGRRGARPRGVTMLPFRPRSLHDATAVRDPEWDLVGRDDELAAIGGFLQAPLPRVLVVEGEPGIGKTSIWRRGLAIARDLGYSVAPCEPAEAERP